jgi:transcriptional regulator with XRE-family HTH domain
MNIAISHNLKELRKKKNNTQEDLAEFLTVSSAAVSKWERGECYPDIEFLPKIASYYDISIDDLFGMGAIKKKERIDEYLAKDYEIFIQEEDRTEIAIKKITLWREAQKEFPNNHTVLFNLIHALNYPDFKPSDNFEEIVQIGERLIAESTDNDIRSGVIYTLCNACVMKKDFENAKRYANMVPSHRNSKEILYVRCLSGEERVEYTQRCIVYFIRKIDNLINGLSGTIYKSSSISGEELLKMYEFVLNLYQLLYPDGDFGDDEQSIANICHILTNLHSGADNDKALYYFNKMADHEVKHWTQSESKHTSFMVNRLMSSGPYDRSKNSIRKFVGQTIKIIEEAEYPDCIRNDERYTAAMEKLKNLLN